MQIYHKLNIKRTLISVFDFSENFATHLPVGFIKKSPGTVARKGQYGDAQCDQLRNLRQMGRMIGKRRRISGFVTGRLISKKGFFVLYYLGLLGYTRQRRCGRVVEGAPLLRE